ncbi:tRNA lysidine(34) synthetase TilS [Nitrosomonas aestuarii]|uniref:tRNA lysidine(34) synthetase TilS n=1 Tax=Nitrosomonas aestuarii TaxID=52441 RepID=UPI000D3071AB|nr:tRNA lysidine(34) synthetase TilS [Nitrosomonas aestuarii]PTN11894.1 tRNA(Ile)-lysidine synthase [Nitrosomonas aestuarii]
MVHSRRKKSNNLDNLIDNVQQVLQTYIRQDCHLAVGLSGGLDSVVLLDILVTLSQQVSFELSAIHVNHGISSHAAQWSHFCCHLCYSHGVPVSVSYVNIHKEAGVSLEAAAREERYHIFNRLRADYLVLAQHQDDQAETLLLQLLRGAGVKGLSAMPIVRKQSSDAAPPILRPLLNVSRGSIEAYARQHQLNWIHDESNDSTDFNRNFLRHAILPVLSRRYPNYVKTLQRTSQHMAEASLLLDDLAASDARCCVEAGNLHISALRELSLPRARNLLRYILRLQQVKLPSTAKLNDILNQLRCARKDTQLHVVFGHTEIRVYKDFVYILPLRKLPPNHLQLKWQGESHLILSELGGSIHFTHVKGLGLCAQKLTQTPVHIKMRQGGERFSPDCKRPRRSLKNLMQEALIPPWERYALPLMFCGEELVWVPGIGIDCEFQSMPEEAGIVPEWRPNDSGGKILK